MQVRTQTLVKNAIVQVDANPFKQYYQQHYGTEVGIKKRAAAAAAAEETEEKATSNRVKRKLKVGDIQATWAANRLFACCFGSWKPLVCTWLWPAVACGTCCGHILQPACASCHDSSPFQL